MDAYVLNQLIFLGFLLLGSMFFSAMETSLLSLSRRKVQEHAEKRGLQGQAFRAWLQHPNRLLTSILIGNNAVNIAAGTLAAYLAVHVADRFGFSRALCGTIASFTLTAVILLFGEVVPKVTARTHPLALAQWLIVPIYLFDRLIFPLTWLVTHLVRWLVPRSTHPTAALVTEEDIQHMLETAEKAGTIEQDEGKMIRSIFRFTDMRVHEVMVPRTEMYCLNVDTPFEEVIEKVIQGGYSRMPVYKNNLDNIVGVLYARDLLSVWRHRELLVLQDLLRKPTFVPETMRVDDLLHEFQRGKFHMAVVVDEYGGTAGLVTLEDLVEEIVGDIRDEYDADEEKEIIKQPDGTYWVDAAVSLERLNRTLGIFLEPTGEVTSLGGYIVDQLGKVPKRGRILRREGILLKVLDADEKRVKQVQITLKEEKTTAPIASSEKEKPEMKKARPKKTPPFSKTEEAS